MKAFGDFHPGALFFYFASVLCVGMFFFHPILSAEALLGAILFLSVLSPRTMRANGGFWLLLFLLVTLTNPLFSHNGVTPLFFLNGNPVTLEAILYGAGLGISVVGLLIWCVCYSQIMTTDKFLCLFSRIIPKFSLVLSMSLRFIPLFLRQSRKVSLAQKSMGLYSSDSIADRIRGRMRVFLAMISWSLENAIDTAASMKARGYGLRGRSHFSLFRFTRRDGGLLILTGLLLSAVGIDGAAGVVQFSYYPRILPPDFSPLAIVGYAAFGLLALLPFFIETKEMLQWKYFVSKI